MPRSGGRNVSANPRCSGRATSPWSPSQGGRAMCPKLPILTEAGTVLLRTSTENPGDYLPSHAPAPGKVRPRGAWGSLTPEPAPPGRDRRGIHVPSAAADGTSFQRVTPGRISDSPPPRQQGRCAQDTVTPAAKSTEWTSKLRSRKSQLQGLPLSLTCISAHRPLQSAARHSVHRSSHRLARSLAHGLAHWEGNPEQRDVDARTSWVRDKGQAA